MLYWPCVSDKMKLSNNSNNGKKIWLQVGDTSPVVFVCDDGSSVSYGRACGVKLCSLAPVTVSDQVIVRASSEILRQRAVKSQFVSLFKLYLPEELLQMACDLIKYDKVSVNRSPPPNMQR